ncbi:hypothetical protein HPP92_003773 [Vanilla planifolia]|uniref:Uncharacterized protein n=1 Tax=Vanilla planifolia TaxID=51239 RepID=A0A835S904_VANPL|nr:hypothetical protein HPP92_003773 [Vanilla planifolia]
MGILPNGGFSRQLRSESSPKQDPCGSKAGIDFLEFFLSKGAESPSMPLPFFCGSPPTRSSNPVVHDARFGEDRPVLSLPSPKLGLTVGGSPLSPRNSGGCSRASASHSLLPSFRTPLVDTWLPATNILKYPPRSLQPRSSLPTHNPQYLQLLRLASERRDITLGQTIHASITKSQYGGHTRFSTH